MKSSTEQLTTLLHLLTKKFQRLYPNIVFAYTYDCYTQEEVIFAYVGSGDAIEICRITYHDKYMDHIDSKIATAINQWYHDIKKAKKEAYMDHILKMQVD